MDVIIGVVMTALLMSLIGAVTIVVLTFAWQVFEDTRLGDMFMDWLESRKEE